MTDPTLRLDPGLASRFQRAVSDVQWRPVAVATPTRSGPPVVRIAHLYEEEARVETRSDRGKFELTVESGPVGALLVVVEAMERGHPQQLTQRSANRTFRSGALRAAWGRLGRSTAATVPFADVVALARYALR